MIESTANKKPPFDTVADMLSFPTSLFADQFVATVKSRRARFTLNKAGGLTADGVYVISATDSSGAQWVRTNYADPTWAAQAGWYVDEGNVSLVASNDNTGADAAHPLLNDLERQARLGDSPHLGLARYDIWYLSDVGDVVLRYRRSQNTIIWVHCGANAFQGQSNIVGAATISARTVLNRTTSARPDITGGTANAHVADETTPNQRLRLVSGANTGATAFAQRNTGASKAAVSQWVQLSTFDPATFALPSAVDPAVNDTYVIEKLGRINSLFVDGVAVGNNGVQSGVVVDSAYVAATGSTGLDSLIFLGCTGVSATDAFQPGMEIRGSSNSMIGCMALGCVTVGSFACYDCSVMPQFGAGFLPFVGSNVVFNNATIAEGCVAIDTTFGGSAVVSDGSAYNSPHDGFRAGAGSFSLSGAMWGTGNAAAGFKTFIRTQILTGSGGSAALLTIAGAQDFVLATVAVGRAWNDATGAYTEAGGAATRSTTWAHLNQSIAAGGFGGNAVDVATGAAIVSTV